MAVDLFSAGCMIFWVVSNGYHPFDNNPFNVVQGHYRKHILEGNPEVDLCLCSILAFPLIARIYSSVSVLLFIGVHESHIGIILIYINACYVHIVGLRFSRLDGFSQF